MTQEEKILHLLKTEPDETQQVLMGGFSMGQEVREIALFHSGQDVDYEELIDLIFEYDKIITWW
jgi:hypothetical protein